MGTTELINERGFDIGSLFIDKITGYLDTRYKFQIAYGKHIPVHRVTRDLGRVFALSRQETHQVMKTLGFRRTKRAFFIKEGRD